MKPAAPARWNAVVASLHWVGALSVLGLLALGAYMTLANLDAAAKFDLYQRHKTLGWLTLVLNAARAIPRLLFAAPAPIASIGALWRTAARAAHLALYALTLFVGFSGWLRVSTAIIPIPIDLFGLTSVPDIALASAGASELWAKAHEVAAYALAVLIALHVAAAMKHHFIDRDATLLRMLGRDSRTARR